MKACIFEHAEREHLSSDVAATGKSVAIVGSKVSAILSGGKLKEESDGGEERYCSVFLDSGQEILVCGSADKTSNCLGIEAEI